MTAVTWSKAKEELLTDMVNEGVLCYREMSLELGISTSTIRLKMDQLGLTYRHDYTKLMRGTDADRMVRKAEGELKHRNGQPVNYGGGV